MWKNYELEILYQDEHYVAINKPSGLLVHKSMIDKDAIYFAMQMLRDQLGMYVYPLHRLDKPTSGVLLFALSSEAARAMSELFSVHAMQKRYIAIVRGYLEEEGIIEHALSHKHDKMTDTKAKEDKVPQEAMTHYKSLARVELPHAIGKYAQTRYSLVELTPKTGRKHQLRRHMKHISHPILGDTKYGRGEHNSFVRQQYSCNRLMLHAMTLEVMHPSTKEKLEIVAPLDTTFTKMFEIFGWSY